MNRIKLRFKSVALMLLLFSSVCPFISCGGDDSDSESGGGLISTLRQYKWMSGNNVEFNEYDTWVELTSDVEVYYFISDTEGILRIHHKWIDSSGIDDEGHCIDNVSFNYTVNGNTINVSTKYGRSTLRYENNSLTDGSEVYRPIKPSSGDWAQINKVREELKYQGNYDFEYTIGFDNSQLSFSVYNTKTKMYTHGINFMFKAPETAILRGMFEFGIALTTEDGTVDNKKGKQGDAYVTIHNMFGLKNVRCFTGAIYEGSNLTWESKVYITSPHKTITLKYAPVFNTGRNPVLDEEYEEYYSIDSQNYIYRNSLSSESFTPTWVIDQDGNVISSGNK